MHKAQPNFASPYATQFTRTGKINMVNGKPYRTANQKAEARRLARKDKDGTYRSTAPVSYQRKAKSDSAHAA